MRTRRANTDGMGISLSRQFRFPSRRAVAAGLVALILAFSPAQSARADAMRDFVVSCSYGVLAGTLVGAATLAFSDKPGENLNRVARGASLGLYAGMLLGAYVVFGVPAEDEDAASQLNHSVNNDLPHINKFSVQKRMEPRLAVYPLISERGIEGAGGQLVVLRF